MVDVGDKPVTEREAIASGRIAMQSHTFETIQAGTAKKGDVLGIARIAGLMAVKRTADLIPLAHPLGIEGCSVDFELDQENLEIKAVCRVRVEAKTGAEMEALTGVSAALLTIYDMVKAIDRGMVIKEMALERKSGGKSGVFARGQKDD